MQKHKTAGESTCTYYAFTEGGLWWLWEENHRHPEWSRLIRTPFSSECSFEFLQREVYLFQRAILVPPEGLPFEDEEKEV